MTNNKIIPFTIFDHAVKGRVVRLDSELNTILFQHQYPSIIAEILGELLIVSAMMGSLFKEEILLTIQLQTESKIKYVVADYQSPGNIRGYAKFDEDIDWDKESYHTLLSKASLILTIDHKLQNGQRYQAIVDVDGMKISEAMEKYFYQSEQIETAVKLAIGKISLLGAEESWCCGGAIIQKLPGEDDEEIWHEALAYFRTISDHELLDPSLAIDKLLYSLYHEVGVTIYSEITIKHKCRCSREKAQQVISTLNHEEAVELSKNNQLSVTCQFCNQTHYFSLDSLSEK